MDSSRASWIIAFCVATAVNIWAQADSPRVLADQKAKSTFLNLNFFSEGRGMHLVPGLIEYYTKVSTPEFLAHRWGVNLVNKKIVGLFSENYKNMQVGVLGCVACHSGKAAGIFIPGLGNKNMDVFQLGKDALFVEKLYSKIGRQPTSNADFKIVQQGALDFAQLLTTERLANLTQGMIPVSFIRWWFYKQAGRPVPDTMTRGAVKIPSLWGYGIKKQVGQFSDGFGDGRLPGWAVAVELTAGQTVEAVRQMLPKIQGAENLFADFLPPPYPFAVHEQEARDGKIIFESTCSQCHGTYSTDKNNLPVYETPKLISLAVVKTDDDRLKANTEDFVHLVDTNPLSDIIKTNHYNPGYFAPRLLGIWSRFPYLHNGSVPTLMALLTAPEQRPKVFSLRDSGERQRFDESQVGLTIPENGSIQQRQLGQKAQQGSREIYDVSREGHSNQGHPFGTQLDDSKKRALIEYLKTL